MSDTEAQALRKICPVLPLYQDAPQLCHVTNCMAWRWLEGEYEYRFTHEGEGIPHWEPWPLQPEEPPTYNAAMTRWRRRVVERHGYCGLAGRPTA